MILFFRKSFNIQPLVIKKSKKKSKEEYRLLSEPEPVRIEPSVIQTIA